MNRESITYLLRFGLGLAVLFGVTRWETFVDAVRKPYCELLAGTMGHVFGWIGIETRVTGATLVPIQGVGGITVVPECDGIVLLALFGAGVVAVPFPRVLRPWLMAAAGVIFLVVLNWFRLAALAYTSFYYPAIFDSMHHYFMQGLLMLAVLALYVAWLRQLEPETGAAPPLEDAGPA